jgi:arylsulfatase A-like enzyme
MAAAALALFVAAAAWGLWRRSGRFVLEPARDQNVLLITIDTLRADALSSYGGPAQTPNLDRLAAHGARFSFAHAHAVVTLPSHTTILTGQLPYAHGIRDNSGFRVPEGTVTLATSPKE